MPVKLSISDQTYASLKLRLTKLRLAFGKNVAHKYTEEFAEHILNGYLQKQENLAKNGDRNTGVDWIEFRRKNFDAIYERDDGKCRYCSKKLTPKESTMDHIVPPLRGGMNIFDNVCLACQWCNVDKSMLTAEEYQYKQLANAAKKIYPPA